MQFLHNLHDYLDSLELKVFYRYVLILLIGTTLITAGLIYYFYSSVHELQHKIDELNDLRAGDVKSILTRIETVKKQRAEVNAILAEDEAFKIGGYFNDLLGLLNIAGNKKEETTSQVALDEEYRESSLTAKFVGINMKQLCELLNIIEQNKRIYTKALEIQKSTKTPKTIDVTLTIATLQPRSAATE